MSQQDRLDWDTTYRGVDVAAGEPRLPAVFAAHSDLFPTTGTALDIACGTGAASVWLARRGLRVHGMDVSPVAIGHCGELAVRHGVAELAQFGVVDLDGGLPAGPSVDVVLCHRFRDRRLYRPMIERLASGGILAVCVLSEVGAAPGRFRAAPGELRDAFAALDVIDADEGGGQAWLLARAATTAWR
ncbi:class I SAM-dependent methyltransferase [Mycobacterium sp. TNTM28]|uniref:Class I SAM-dependent methyltransferase n=1 Tax=[Mycobacterium] fortunisiensis TaxID=2600579 RepID=A0ABS6KQ60_9MYCO|nr:class I SAM-dependent methyltransferase [[Mycobacterium] fortunisiensis]MBU9765757.1 class I SAM-dependent methyltransferase [[Mycobacterium] fortunisiensis]